LDVKADDAECYLSFYMLYDVNRFMTSKRYRTSSEWESP